MAITMVLRIINVSVQPEPYLQKQYTEILSFVIE